MSKSPAIVHLLWCLALLPGCISDQKANPAATQPVTVGDPAEATAEYWLNKPPAATVNDRDFGALFDAAEETAREYQYPIERRDHRQGLLLTQPVISKQWFELWRKDVGSGGGDVAEASLNPIRRTIHFQFAPNPDGSFTVAPKVLVERFSRVDLEYREQYAIQQTPTSYWYALRRDTALEERIADDLRRRLKSESH